MDIQTLRETSQPSELASDHLRALWYGQQLTTDEAVIGWNDKTLRDFHDMDWSSTDGFITNLYYRIFYQRNQISIIILCIGEVGGLILVFSDIIKFKIKYIR